MWAARGTATPATGCGRGSRQGASSTRIYYLYDELGTCLSVWTSTVRCVRRTPILHYIDYASRHPTVLHKLIAQSGGWATSDDEQKALRGQLGKHKQMLEVQIGNYVKALGDGKMSNAILAALEIAESDKLEVCRQMLIADQEIATSTIKRPTAVQVSEAWGNIKGVWKVLDAEDRADLLGSFVQAVELTEKEEVILELWTVSISSPLVYSEEFKLNSQLGASREVIANNFPLLTTHTFPPIELDYDIIRPKRMRCAS